MAKSDEREDQPPGLTRRGLFRAASAAVATASIGVVFTPESSAAVAGDDGTAKPRAKARHGFLRADEAAFITAATARLIPGDLDSPGAEQADVTRFIDQALASPWGKGDRMYTSGPWKEGTPQQGYQLKFTPAELYRTALTAILREQKKLGTPFAETSAEDQDAYLQKLEAGQVDLDGVPSSLFFDMLLQNTIEGFLSDPSHGGNADMVGWKAIGFPGVFASWYDLADKHGINLDQRAANPLSIADAAGHSPHSKGKPE